LIAFVYGTTGELIKLAPILRRLQERRDPLLQVCTGQQVEQIPTMLRDFGLPQPDLWVGRGYRGGDLERPLEIPRWLAEVSIGFARRRRQLRARLVGGGGHPLVVVHGDTFTTIIGALMGRSLGVPVAHVEAGMRSGSIRQPFPEELNRRATAKVARIHFAPGERAVRNLLSERTNGEVVDTGQNTIRDNLSLIPPDVPIGVDLPDEPFGLVSLHRFELIEREGALRPVLELLSESSRRKPLLFVDHPTTAAAVDDAGLGYLFDDGFVRIPRLRYFHFLALLTRSEFLVTDSGGSQEECAYLGHPCLIHRAVTEHDTGLDGGSIVLSGLDLEVVRDFLADPSRFRREPPPEVNSPTGRIVAHLERHGYLAVAEPQRASKQAS
jgi:UDP-N-acetylglucosamine 2-epimerase (non-hydrolysing)